MGSDSILGGGNPLGPPQQWAHTIQQLSLCGRQLRRLLGEVSLPWNLSDTEFLLLWICNEDPAQPGVPQHDLAISLGVSGAQMSGLVYDLRDRGLLTLERPAHDRRRQLLRITRAGQLLLLRVVEAMAPVIQELERRIQFDDHQTLSRLLGRLIESTRDGKIGGLTGITRPEAGAIRRAS